MAARLTDRQKKKIIADYIELGSYNAVAKIHGVTRQTIKNVVNADPESGRKFQRKKDENTRDILAHMDTKREKVCQFIDLYLDELMNPARLERATPSQLSTALGTVIDKFTMTAKANSDIEDITPLKDLLGE